MKYAVTAVLAAGLLGGCANGTGQTMFPSIDQQAGAQLNDGIFGSATVNNHAVQTGQQDYTVSLQNRFAAEVPDTINFAFNSSALDATAIATLQRQADWIRQFPEVRFKVFGHTDLVGSDAYNRALGLRRAQTAVSYLVSQGVSASRLEAVVTFGETRPVVATQSPERRNRRTVTEVAGFVNGSGRLLDGKYAQIIYREYVQSATRQSDVGATTVGGGGGGGDSE